MSNLVWFVLTKVKINRGFFNKIIFLILVISRGWLVHVVIFQLKSKVFMKSLFLFLLWFKLNWNNVEKINRKELLIKQTIPYWPSKININFRAFLCYY